MLDSNNGQPKKYNIFQLKDTKGHLRDDKEQN
jgi:hypothetical protein